MQKNNENQSSLSRIKDRMNNHVSISDLITLLDTLPTPVVYKRYDGILSYCNQAFLEFNNLSYDEVIGNTLFDILPHDQAEIYRVLDKKVMDEQIVDFQEHEIFYRGNEARHIMISRAAHIDENGQSIGIIGVFQDVTKSKKQERQSQVTLKIREIFWSINQSLMEFDDDTAFFNRILIEIVKVFRGMRFASVMTLKNDQLNLIASYNFKQNEIEAFSIHIKDSYIWNHMKDSLSQATVINNIQDTKSLIIPTVDTVIEAKVESSLVIPICFKNNLKWFLFLDSDTNNAFDDIDIFSANFLQEEIPIFYRIYKLTSETLELSRNDKLTGLMNRTYFDMVFEQRLLLCKRDSTSLIVIGFDLDGLKVVNDTFGHMAGDHYIRSFTEFLTSHFRESDVFARVGGDEFIGLLISNDVKTLLDKLNHLRMIFESTNLFFEDKLFQGSFSFGVSVYPTEASTPDQLISIADKNMYHDKQRKDKKLSR